VGDGDVRRTGLSSQPAIPSELASRLYPSGSTIFAGRRSRPGARTPAKVRGAHQTREHSKLELRLGRPSLWMQEGVHLQIKRQFGQGECTVHYRPQESAARRG
jgi:hypothetical protein